MDSTHSKPPAEAASSTRCGRCVLDGSVPNLDLDGSGVCGYCRSFDLQWPRYLFSEAEEKANLERIASEIRGRRRKGGEYDVLVGLSGGVDSSYVALLAHRLGLKALCVHFDNGWNAREAVANIRRIIDVTGFDLETYVIDWPEFRDLQRAYIKAGVIDIEALTDHAIWAANDKIRREHKISTMLSGENYATEHGMPPSWGWPKKDWRNIKAIHRRYGEGRLRTFPHTTSLRFLFKEAFGLGGRFARPLNEMNYRRELALRELKSEFAWEYYGGKHYESLFTRFYQAHILPTKFGVDKRLVHWSALVRTGEVTREDALVEIGKPIYDPDTLARDVRYVCKKLGFSQEELEGYLAQPPRSHWDFPSDQRFMQPLLRVGSAVKRKILPARRG